MTQISSVSFLSIILKCHRTFLKMQARTCKLCIASYTTSPNGLNPLLAKFKFSPLVRIYLKGTKEPFLARLGTNDASAFGQQGGVAGAGPRRVALADHRANALDARRELLQESILIIISCGLMNLLKEENGLRVILSALSYGLQFPNLF